MQIPNCLVHAHTLRGEPSAPEFIYILTHLMFSVRQEGSLGTKVPHLPLKNILQGKAMFLTSERESCNQKNCTETYMLWKKQK